MLISKSSQSAEVKEAGGETLGLSYLPLVMRAMRGQKRENACLMLVFRQGLRWPHWGFQGRTPGAGGEVSVYKSLWQWDHHNPRGGFLSAVCFC